MTAARRPQKGRGATFNPANRFERTTSEPFDDGWGSLDRDLADAAPIRTEVLPDASRSVIAHNTSPDLPFSQSINPYRGCEHGCIYCYARPSHAYLGLSPGIDFETRLFAKHDAAALLEQELARPGYRCSTIALGANTDPYQPVERRLGITRRILEVLASCRHPVGIVTKSAAVTRDLDVLGDLAADGLVRVFLSITTLEPGLARWMEPRAAAPHRRLEAVRALSEAGVPVGVMMAPIIPGLNDGEIEAVLEASADAGAGQASYVLLRLPHEIKDLFQGWLEQHAPLRAGRILALIRACRDGQLNDARFGRRMVGAGPYPSMIARRFEVGARRRRLDGRRMPLRTDLFRPPAKDRQLPLL